MDGQNEKNNAIWFIIKNLRGQMDAIERQIKELEGLMTGAVPTTSIFCVDPIQPVIAHTTILLQKFPEERKINAIKVVRQRVPQAAGLKEAKIMVERWMELLARVEQRLEFGQAPVIEVDAVPELTAEAFLNDWNAAVGRARRKF